MKSGLKWTYVPNQATPMLSASDSYQSRHHAGLPNPKQLCHPLSSKVPPNLLPPTLLPFLYHIPSKIKAIVLQTTMYFPVSSVLYPAPGYPEGSEEIILGFLLLPFPLLCVLGLLAVGCWVWEAGMLTGLHLLSHCGALGLGVKHWTGQPQAVSTIRSLRCSLHIQKKRLLVTTMSSTALCSHLLLSYVD